jgi:hypothetical protein
VTNLVTNVREVLEELNLQIVEHQIELAHVLPNDPTETTILKQLSHDPMHIACDRPFGRLACFDR